MVIGALDRKLLRDLRRLTGQGATIALVVAAGIAAYVSSVSTYDSLERAQRAYYERARLGDVFVRVERAPRGVAADVARIPGVREVETRIVEDVTLDMPGLADPAGGRLVSLPDHGGPRLNDVHLRQGRMPEPGHAREAVVSEAFATAHGLGPGSTVVAILQGRRTELLVVGVGLSPEYIFVVRPGEITADDKRFGVLWMRERQLAPVFQMEGAFNELVARLQPGASFPRVRAAIDRVMERWGGLGALGQAELMSVRIVQGELDQLDSMAGSVPIMFLAVAAFLVNVVLNRLLRLQREQIAALKALGYTNREVGSHYLRFALVIVGVGAILGVLLGAWLGDAQVDLYRKFFRLPDLTYRLEWGSVVAAVLVSLAAGVSGALFAVRRAVRIPPAEAMRPEPPAVYHPTLLERVGFHRLLGTAGRMIWRDLERQPIRTVLSSLAIALSIAILIAGRFSMDSVTFVLAHEFERSQRQDLTVTFRRPVPLRAAASIGRLPAVLFAEPLRAAGARLRFGHRSREVGIMGIEPGSALRRVLDPDGRIVPLPRDGALVSRKLAELLGARAGDVVQMELLEGQRQKRPLLIAAIVDDYVGLAVTMRRETLHRLLGEAPTATGVLLLVDRSRLAELERALRRLPNLGGMARRELVFENFRKQNADVLLVFIVILAAFASVIAVAVVYNNARVALSMRSRDLATLRVLGFTRAEVSAILLGEQAVQVLLAIPPGLLAGYGLATLVTGMVDPEMFRLPVVVNPPTYAFAVAVVLVAAIVSALLVRRRVDQLDMVSVLKARD